MALKLSKTLPSGVTVEYWAIIATGYLKTSNSTGWTLAPYVSKAVRDAGVENYIPEAIISGHFEGELTRDEIYLKITEPKPELVSPAVEAVAEVPAVLDEEGNVVTEAVPAIEAVAAVYIETNEWSNAEAV